MCCQFLNCKQSNGSVCSNAWNQVLVCTFISVSSCCCCCVMLNFLNRKSDDSDKPSIYNSLFFIDDYLTNNDEHKCSYFISDFIKHLITPVIGTYLLPLDIFLQLSSCCKDDHLRWYNDDCKFYSPSTWTDKNYSDVNCCFTSEECVYCCKSYYERKHGGYVNKCCCCKYYTNHIIGDEIPQNNNIISVQPTDVMQLEQPHNNDKTCVEDDAPRPI